MTYNSEEIESFLNQKGELIIVLESDVRFELHIHDTTFDHSSGDVITEGMKDGEYVYAQFPAERVEHVTWHKES